MDREQTETRLSQWGEWVRHHAPARGYPSASPLARLSLYGTRLPPHPGGEALSDFPRTIEETDRALSRLFMQRDRLVKRVVFLVYIGNQSPTVVANQLRVNRARVIAVLTGVHDYLGGVLHD